MYSKRTVGGIFFVLNKRRQKNEMNERTNKSASMHVLSPPDDSVRNNTQQVVGTQICSAVRVSTGNLNSFLVFLSCFPVIFSSSSSFLFF